MLGRTAHIDTFTRDNLPPAEQWPELPLGEFQYPEELNAAFELTDRMVARGFGDHVALIGNGRRRTYKELSDWTNRIAHALVEDYSIKPGNRILIHGCHTGLEAAFRRQHGAPSFPVDFERLPAKIEFITLQPGVAADVAGYRVTPMRQRHSGDSYGYRLEKNGKCVVYSTDSEHRPEQTGELEVFARFFHGADLVIFDAMYSLADAASVKEDWGHSSNITGVELCQMARARRLCLFHHEPAYSDVQLEAVLRETRRLEEITRGGEPLEIISAHDGLVVNF